MASSMAEVMFHFGSYRNVFRSSLRLMMFSLRAVSHRVLWYNTLMTTFSRSVVIFYKKNHPSSSLVWVVPTKIFYMF